MKLTENNATINPSIICIAKRHKLKIKVPVILNDQEEKKIENISLNFDKEGSISEDKKYFEIFPFKGIFNSDNRKPYSKGVLEENNHKNYY